MFLIIIKVSENEFSYDVKCACGNIIKDVNTVRCTCPKCKKISYVPYMTSEKKNLSAITEYLL